MSQSQPGGSYERSDARNGPIVWFTVGLALVSVAVLVGARWMSAAFESAAARGDAPVHPMATPGTPPPGPRLQANPVLELEAYRRVQSSWIEEYGWIDREQGLVHVPIERAMELVLEEGLPERSR